MTDVEIEVDYLRGYRAALAKMMSTISTDPMAVPPAQAYRNATDIEALQAHVKAQTVEHRMQAEVVDARREVARFNEVARNARDDRDQARIERDEALALVDSLLPPGRPK